MNFTYFIVAKKTRISDQKKQNVRLLKTPGAKSLKNLSSPSKSIASRRVAPMMWQGTQLRVHTELLFLHSDSEFWM